MSNAETEQESGSGNEQKESPQLLRTWLREKSGSRWWLGLVLEAGLIVFSVLLALGVNQWRAESAKAQKAQTALEAIRSELVANKEAFKSVGDHHESIQDTLMYYQEQDLKPPMKLLSGGIFNPATVRTTAWETAKQSGIIDYFDYKLVLDLSALYQRQSEYKSLGKAIGENFYVAITMDKSVEAVLQDNYENWILLLGDFSRREQGFAEGNDEMIQKLKEAIEGSS